MRGRPAAPTRKEAPRVGGLEIRAKELGDKRWASRGLPPPVLGKCGLQSNTRSIS